MSVDVIDALCTLDDEAETLTIKVVEELPLGATTLKIEYTGILNDQMTGFYRSKYSHPDHPGEERYAAVTHFEALGARQALPCWDEPVHKASFDVTLVVPKDRVALSNMVRTTWMCVVCVCVTLYLMCACVL